MTQTNLSVAQLLGAFMKGAQLTGANLSSANLVRADLAQAVLTGAIMSGADLSSANLTRANLRGAMMPDVILTNANFSGADLSGAKSLTGDQLAGAVIDEATRLREGIADLASSRHAKATGTNDHPGAEPRPLTEDPSVSDHAPER